MIEAKNLRRTFGPIIAVDDISFKVEKGEVLGFLGPNGAGKSTAMRMLACFLAPDSGTATVRGHDIIKSPVAVRKSVGYLAENAPAYGEMTVSSFLNFICDARSIKGADRKKALDRIVEMCSIGSVYHQTIDTLSKGYCRRVGLAQALIHDPPVLVLDEPTDEEVEAVCSRMIIIDHGRILADSTPEKLKQEYKGTLDEVFRKITKKKSA
jgi:ABC-2 type transport system ATP-binding protein